LAKQLKINIKNAQIAKKVNLDQVKKKIAGAKKEPKKKEEKPASKPEDLETPAEEPKRIRAKSKSSFAADKQEAPEEQKSVVEPVEEAEEVVEQPQEEPAPIVESVPEPKEVVEEAPPPPPPPKAEKKEEAPPVKKPKPIFSNKLGPTGRHIKDLLPPKPEKKPEKAAPAKDKSDAAKKGDKGAAAQPSTDRAHRKVKKARDFKDLKPSRKDGRGFNPRDRKGLGDQDDDRWRKRRGHRHAAASTEEYTVRPSELSIRLPISIKELASSMKRKASELIQKLFLQGIVVTLNDQLDDETTVEFLGGEFECQITIDTSEEQRIQITPKTVSEEIAEVDPSELITRPPVVTFMGHVDHGKTSLIDAIRESNRVSAESGSITQHIGAFQCTTKVGDLTILDTPGHEAFSAMRARGAQTTDIVVLVIAGDEGMRDQTKEAIQHAQAAGVTIVVAINKSDKPNFNAENIYRELSEIQLLPEAWGGQTITVCTSAVTKEGIPELLEMLALQAEILELRAAPKMRARGIVIESELHKGLGNVATMLVQNGTLHQGDAVVFERHFGRVKTMHNDKNELVKEAGPSTPIEITGLSGLPSAGDPFIVVKSEKEAKSIAEARSYGIDQRALMQKKPMTLEKFMTESGEEKKVLKLIIRADVQGSMEALKTSILRIESDKVEADIIFTGVGEISESDVQLAQASNAIIIGFHTAVESHAESLIKEYGVRVSLFDIIYHAIDEVKLMMKGMLDKISEEKLVGQAEVKAVFKASQLGSIAGCQVSTGIIHRNNLMKVVREGEVVWQGKMTSLKRVKEDVKEVKKGVECGILLDGYNQVQEGDLLEAYEIIYLTQEI